MTVQLNSFEGRKSGSDKVTSLVAELPDKTEIRVLMLDDDPDDVVFLKRIIEAVDGFEMDVTTVTSVVAARDAAERETFDVHLVDFWMGAETTVPLIHELSEHLTSPVVIVLSSLDEGDFQEVGLRAGACQFLSKNAITAVSLEAAIRSGLHGAKELRGARRELLNFEQRQRNGAAALKDWTHGLDSRLNRIQDHLALILNEMDDLTFTGNCVRLTEALGDLNEVKAEVSRVGNNLRSIDRVGQLSKESVNVWPLLDAIVRDCQAEAMWRSQTIVFEKGNVPLNVSCDSQALADAFTAILKGIVRHTSAGTHIRIGLILDEGLLYVAITDTGTAGDLASLDVGQLDMKSARIAGADQVLTDDRIGGLLIADQIVRDMGGSVDLDVSEDAATTTIAIPVR
ncbi:MAG: response regulator [Pseudomonadota bacterium]